MKLLMTPLCALVLMSCAKTELPEQPSSLRKREAALTLVQALYTPAGCTATVQSPLDPTVQSWSCVRTLNIAQSTYDIDVASTASGNICEMHIMLKDCTGGLLVQNDSVVVTEAFYTICGVTYNLLADHSAVVTVVGNEATIEYTDCIVPTNGSNGSFVVKLSQ
jgi:hypothetical protein